MKLLSDASEYGLRAVVWLAQRPGQAQKVREIAQGTQAAPGYLVKVLQALAKAHILSAQRGSHGGFRLERDPFELSVLEVVNAIDPIQRIHACPLGFQAHRQCLCPTHRRIDDAMATIEQSFGEATIADLVTEPARPGQVCTRLVASHATPAAPATAGAPATPGTPDTRANE
ncbi:MAG: Rrf2 family transcriptional regulator [Phycisphaeraceae bacterium]